MRMRRGGATLAERMDALVIGAGVIGLTAAIRLLERGARVHVWTAEETARATSSVAAALWYPYRVAPEAQVAAWGRRTFEVFAEDARDASTGVAMVPGVEILGEGMDAAAFPDWTAAVPDFRVAAAHELPAGCHGWAFTAPIADTSAYLPWLARRFTAAGGTMEMRRAQSLAEAAEACEVVVNCTGLGAETLVGDASLVPIRGQVVRVENPGISRFWLDDYRGGGLTYIIPRSRDCILGGTADEGSRDLTVDPETAEAIIRRCAALEPALAGARVLEHRVGLRPGRAEVRLEAESLAGGGRVVHCYGHGGAGVTLCWGCAEAVADLVLGPV